MKYEDLKVAQLKELSKERGLHVSSHSHKFSKSDLIDQLRRYDEEIDMWEDEDIEDTSISEFMEESVSTLGNEEKGHEKDDNREEKHNGVVYARTFDEIMQKYNHRKPGHVYQKELRVGGWVVYVHTGKGYGGIPSKRLRRARVEVIDRKSETIQASLISGDIVNLHFNDLLYIKGSDSYKYPNDLFNFIKHQ